MTKSEIQAVSTAPLGMALPLALGLVAACAGAPAPSPVMSSAERDGLVLRIELRRLEDSLSVDSSLANEGAEAVHLVPDQCGRVTEVLLTRTVFQPEGRTWSGSLQAVKALVLQDQVFAQHPDRFHPRRPGDASPQVPDCTRPDGPIELAPGEAIDERWELPLASAPSLDAVGSAGTVVRVEVVEARGTDELEYLDILPTGSADEERAGRNLRVEEPAASVIERPARGGDEGPSLGELYDRLIEHATLRTWIEAQPEDGWRHAALGRQLDGSLELRAVSTSYERAALVTAASDGGVTSVRLPTESDRTRVFARRPAALPPGVTLIPEPESFGLTEDVLVGDVRLPSGRVVVGEYLLEGEPLDVDVDPGAYPAHVTLARHRDSDHDTVALSTLVVSAEPTVRWEQASQIAVDGGTAAFTSSEGVALLFAEFERDEDAWMQGFEDDFDSLVAHDYLATEVAIEGDVNLVMSSSGVGDGGYPVFVGYDAAGRPTRVVIDFLLVHLAWPVPGWR